MPREGKGSIRIQMATRLCVVPSGSNSGYQVAPLPLDRAASQLTDLGKWACL
jgi:hypothetical protein